MPVEDEGGYGGLSCETQIIVGVLMGDKGAKRNEVKHAAVTLICLLVLVFIIILSSDKLLFKYP